MNLSFVTRGLRGLSTSEARSSKRTQKLVAMEMATRTREAKLRVAARRVRSRAMVGEIRGAGEGGWKRGVRRLGG